MGGLRVVSVIDAATVSGPGKQLLALATRLAEAGISLGVITFRRGSQPRSPLADRLLAAGVRVAVLEDSGPLDVRLIGRLRAALDAWQPDIVQSHGYRPTALTFALRAAGARWRWIAFFHGATHENRKVRVYNWLDQRLMPFADRIVVMSERARAQFSRNADRVRVIHNAVIPFPEEEDARARAERALTGLDADRPTLGVIGRLSPEKGVDVLLGAAALLVDRGLDFSVLVVGDGQERERLEHQCARLGLTDRVHFAGSLAAVGPVYDRLDLLVIPSRTEGLPNVLLEALRADVPVVATAVGAVPEVLDRPEAGVIVPPGSAEALASGIATAMALRHDPAGSAARRVIAERFSLERRAAAHADLYAELVGDSVASRDGAPLAIVGDA